ncbi:MAG: flagellar basal body rod protein FlgB [Deltaproteobacteria bacterium]|nr:flagellar basal body rod protein FlgB [Deltaproteobacteria bacterium]
MSEILCDRLMGRSTALLSRALDYRAAKHKVISGNLANVDTPGYKPRRLEFNEELKRELDRTSVPVRTTHRKHFSHSSGAGQGGDRLEEAGKLSIEREMAEMVQNNLLYDASTRLLSKKFEALKMAIESGRR